MEFFHPVRPVFYAHVAVLFFFSKKICFLGATTCYETRVLRYGLERPVIIRILRSFGWVSYDKIGGLYSGKLGSRSEARASDLGSYPGLWWKRIKLHLYEGTKVSTL